MPYKVFQGIMRILYLHQYFYTPATGGGTRSYEFGKRLAASGHDVHIVTTVQQKAPEKGSSWRSESVDGMTIHWLYCDYSNHMGFYRRVWAFLYFAFHASLKGMKIKGDLVFATSTPLTIAIPGIIISKLKKTPMVFEVRDLWPELPIAIGALKNPILKYLARTLEKVAYSSSECVIALSPGMKRGVVATGYDADRVAIIPNSCDSYFTNIDPNKVEPFVQKRAWINDNHLVVYTGTFGVINGVGYLVNLAEAVEKLNKNIKFLLIGGGLEFDDVKQKAKDRNLLDRTIFVEDATDKIDIAIVLSLATVATSLFIDLPEMESNSANKFFDALASGTPVLINYGGWQKDLVENNNLGLAVNGLKIDEVAQKLSDFVENSEQQKISSSEALRVAQDLFGRDTLAAKFEEILKVASKRRGKCASKNNYV